MVVEYIRYNVADEQRNAFESAYEQAASALIASPHCLRYELARSVDEPTSFILRIEWDSVDGHLQGFRRSPQFRAFFQAVGPFVNNIQEMRHYEVTSVRGEKV